VIENYKKMLEKTFPANCREIVKMVKEISSPELRIEEDINKNFVIDLYDLDVAQARVAGVFIKELQGITVYSGDKFVKFLPSGLAWLGCYGKIELITNTEVDHPLLKNGIWFIFDEEANKIIPVYPVKNAQNTYEQLKSLQLKELLLTAFA